jgi:hypothetical protein
MSRKGSIIGLKGAYSNHTQQSVTTPIAFYLEYSDYNFQHHCTDHLRSLALYHIHALAWGRHALTPFWTALHSALLPCHPRSPALFLFLNHQHEWSTTQHRLILSQVAPSSAWRCQYQLCCVQHDTGVRRRAASNINHSTQNPCHTSNSTMHGDTSLQAQWHSTRTTNQMAGG